MSMYLDYKRNASIDFWKNINMYCAYFVLQMYNLNHENSKTSNVYIVET